MFSQFVGIITSLSSVCICFVFFFYSSEFSLTNTLKRRCTSNLLVERCENSCIKSFVKSELKNTQVIEGKFLVAKG